MKRSMAPVLAGLMLTATACGGDSDSATPGAAEVTIALPFASCLAWWPFYVAADKGYFEDAGIKPQFEGLDGSAAAIQATLSGKAELAMSAPDNYLTAAASGAEVTGLYSFYTSQAFFLVTPVDSDIATLDDVAGKTVGISTPGGGDVTYADSLLKLGADLSANEDYQQLAVGDGGAAAIALQKGAIDAYAASYFDEEIMKAGGTELRQLASDDYPDVVGDLLVGSKAWVDENSDTVDGIGKAIAQGTDYGLANRDEVIDICGKAMPEETEDVAFAKTIVDRVADLVTPTASAGGEYGHIDEDAWTAYRDLLIDLGTVGGEAADTEVDNSHVDAWNS